MRPHIARAAAVFIALSCAVPARRAVADGPPQDSTFSPQLFHPAVGPDEFFTVEPARPLAHRNFSLGLWANYGRAGFTLFNVDKNGITSTRASILRDTLGFDAVFAIGLLDRLQIGLGLPVTAYQAGDDPASIMPPLTYNGDPFKLKTPGAFALGDPWLDIKVRLFGHEQGMNLAIAAFVTAPLSALTKSNALDDSGNFGGESGTAIVVDGNGKPVTDDAGAVKTESVAAVTAGGKVLAGWEGERWRAGVSIGFLWRQHVSHSFSSVVGNELQYAAAFAYDVSAQRRVSLIAEINGRADLSNKDDKGNFTISNINGVPLEADLGAKFRVKQSMFLTLGAGAGIVRGLGAPLVRGFLGFTWSPDRRDRDRDGVPDLEDKCPDTPEDRDGFKDDDGCPELDNDGDQIPDERDRCPNDAEDYDNFEDDDGCPEPDNDKDGIPDIKDNCPLDAEDHKPPRADDGCPMDKIDSDEDGISDGKDKCPLDPEDKDGFQDDDGCPDPDNDNDDIPDGFDKCPNAAEDKDNFQDDDGCPEPDNDGDGVLDGADKCPTEPETLNGFQDEDGCPDKGPPLKVQVVGDEIIILEKVFFKTNKAVIESRSYNLLDQVTSVLKFHPEIRKVLIEGHTDNAGKRDKNMKLSQDRAEAVKTYLVGKGLPAARLQAQGFGPDRPVADNKSSRGREANRRVQFKIAEQDKKPEEAPPPETPPAAPAPETAPPPAK